MNIRTSYAVAGGLTCVMLAAVAWRASPIPAAWQLPFHTHGAASPAHVTQFLSIPPACLAFVAVSLRFEEWRRKGQDASTGAWHQWNDRFVLGYGVMVTGLFAYMLADTLGYGGGLNLQAGKLFILAVSGLLVWGANQMPKLPPLTTRWGIERGLNEQSRASVMRLPGQLLVGLGLAAIVSRKGGRLHRGAGR